MSEQAGGDPSSLQSTARPAEHYAAPPTRPPAVSEAVLITDSMLEDKRVDFERGMRYGSTLTLTLIVVLIAAFAWQVASDALSDAASLTMSGALVRDRVLTGEVWRLVSAAFLHGGFDHLAGNCISLYILGLGTEHAFGARGMAIVFLASAIGGSLLSILVSPGPSVGASGAIFGLMSALVIVLHRRRDKIFVRDKRIGVVVAAWAAYTLLLGALNPVVDNAAHLGGLIAGAFVGGLVRVRLLAE